MSLLTENGRWKPRALSPMGNFTWNHGFSHCPWSFFFLSRQFFVRLAFSWSRRVNVELICTNSAHMFVILNYCDDWCRRGLAATRVLRKGELVLRVPKSALMTSDCLISEDQKLYSALGKYPLLSSTQVSLLCVCLNFDESKRRQY